MKGDRRDRGDRGDGGRRVSVATARLDFNVGYVGTSILALAFVILGAGVMYPTGRTFSPQGTTFVTQLVELYTGTLGEWTRPFVLVAVTTTIVSTALTVMDGFPRALERTFQNLSRDQRPPVGPGTTGRLYWWSVAVLFVVTEIVLLRFMRGITAMIDFATILSFLTAPVVGWLTLRVATSPKMPAEHRPGQAMRILAWLGLLLLGGTGLVWLLV